MPGFLDEIKAGGAKQRLRKSSASPPAPAPKQQQKLSNPMDELKARLANRLRGSGPGPTAAAAKPKAARPPIQRPPAKPSRPPVQDASVVVPSAIRQFYASHNPEKLTDTVAMGHLLAKYKGKEEVLLRKLHKKYGVPYGGKKSAKIAAARSEPKKQAAAAAAAAKQPAAAPAAAAGGSTTAASWTEHRTVDGRSYFTNVENGEVTWEKPVELMSAEERSERDGDWVWVPHKDHGFAPARIVAKTSDGGANVELLGTKETLQISGKVLNSESCPRITSLASLREDRSDLVQLDEVNKPSILHLLRERFKRDAIYTSVGDILVSLNPFRRLPLYTPSVMAKYMDKSLEELAAGEVAPHPFLTADLCFRRLVEKQEDQAILISGESGAGKTETVKQCLQTLRNDNSSRFGKWMEIHFDTEHRMRDCSITDYLLEKTRVVFQTKGERNYHIFYQLCACAGAAASGSSKTEAHFKAVASAPTDSETELDVGSMCLDELKPVHALTLTSLGSGDLESFDYLVDPSSRIHNRDELQEFREMLAAMEMMRLSAEEVRNVLTTTAAVLHLGNASFAPPVANLESGDGDGATVLAKGRDALEVAATLLGLGDSDGADRLAADARDALAKSIYSNLFEWIVRRLNDAMSGRQQEGTSAGSIGVLDIFGFEIFEKNSFEQLCINYANEKLQQHFNEHTFSLEEQTYESEGVEFAHVSYVDNQPVLDLIEHHRGGRRSSASSPKDTRELPNGLFVMLDDEISVPRATDLTFLSKLNNAFGMGKHPNFSDRCKSKTAFKVIHYAGEVTYEVGGFLDKNKDRLVDDLVDLVHGSTNPFVLELFKDDSLPHTAASSSPGSAAKDGGGKHTSAKLGGAIKAIGVAHRMNERRRSSSSRGQRSQGTKFKLQLVFLMSKLASTYPHYVRCIKPNQQKVPEAFDAPLVLQQLLCAGVLEAITIRQQGYPFRHTHESFYRRFRWLACPAWAVCAPSSSSSSKQAEAAAEARRTVRPIKRESYSSACKELLEEISKQASGGSEGGAADPALAEAAAKCVLGKTLVLYRSPQHRTLELQLALRLSMCAKLIQAHARRMLVVRRVADLRAVREQLRSALAARTTAAINEALHASRALGGFFTVREHSLCEGCRTALAKEDELRARISSAATLDAESNPVIFEPLCKEISENVAADPLSFQWDEAKAVLAKWAAVVDQREARRGAAAVLAMRFDPKADPLAEGCFPSALEERLAKASAAIDTLHQAHAGAIEEASCRALQQRCEARRARLARERELALAVFSFFDPSLVPTGEPWSLDATATRGSIEPLSASIRCCRAVDSCGEQPPPATGGGSAVEEERGAGEVPPCGMLTSAGQRAVDQGEAVLNLRKSLVSALDSGARSAKERPWIAVEAALTLARDASTTTSSVPRASLSCDGLEGTFCGEECTKLEYEIVNRELGYRGDVDDVMARLEEAMSTLFDASLETALGQAKALHMEEHPDPTVTAQVSDATQFLAAVRAAQDMLRDAAEAPSISETDLRAAIEYSESFGFGDEHRAGKTPTDTAKSLLARVERLTARAVEALRLVERPEMEDVVSEAAEIRLKKDTVPALGELAMLLAKPHALFLQEQLRAANRLGDRERATRVTIEIKDEFLGLSSSKAMFQLPMFPNLKPCEEWGRRFGISNDKLAASMLKWSKRSIHTSLTRIADPDPEGLEDPQHKQHSAIKKSAKKLFKNVLGYMGDKKYEYPAELAHELLKSALETPQLRDEIYLQVIKQLTDNPSADSVRYGWNLMALCCTTFPPSEQFSNYLEVYLRDHGETECIDKLHVTMYGELRDAAPSSSQCGRVRSMRAGFTGLSFRQKNSSSH